MEGSGGERRRRQQAVATGQGEDRDGRLLGAEDGSGRVVLCGLAGRVVGHGGESGGEVVGREWEGKRGKVERVAGSSAGVLDMLDVLVLC